MNSRPIAVIRKEQIEVERLTRVFKGRWDNYLELKKFTDKAARDEIEAFLLLAETLREIRSRLGHGKWKGWLQTNFDRSYETATRWIRVAQWARENMTTQSCLASLSALMRAAGEDQRPRVEDAPSQLCMQAVLQRLRPALRLKLEDVLQLPIADQHELRTALDPVHALWLALPAPASPAALESAAWAAGVSS